MSCYNPKGTHDEYQKACYYPCGVCIGCRLDYARDWSVRIRHEAQMHEENDYLTLTYNDENLPEGGTLIKEELQGFIKKLRKHLDPKRIRFYGVGEYGDEIGQRPHYHIIVFGHEFPDKKIWKVKKWKWKKGFNYIYRSAELESLWTKGFSSAGEVTKESANYVARYVIKKVKGKKAKEYYKGRVAEFALMSRMDGIGKTWYDKYKTDLFPKDYVTIDGKRYPIPRYYDELLKKENIFKWAQIKKRRKEDKEKKDYEHSLRLWQKEMAKAGQTRTLERGLT